MLDSGTRRGLCPGRCRAHRSLSSCSSMSRSSCSQKKSAATWVAEHCLFPNADAKVRTFHDTAKSFHDFFQKKSKMGTQGAGNGGRRGQRRGKKRGKGRNGRDGSCGRKRERTGTIFIYVRARKGEKTGKKAAAPTGAVATQNENDVRFMDLPLQIFAAVLDVHTFVWFTGETAALEVVESI